MTDEHWLGQMKRIAEDFEGSDVKSFRFTKINGKVTCTVVVLNASHEAVVYELVDDATSRWQTTSFERWRKVDAEKVRPSEVRQTFLSALTR